MKWETTIFHIKKCRIRLKDSNQDSEELILGSDVNILIQDPGTKFCFLILLIIWSTDTVNTGKDQNPTLKGEKKKRPWGLERGNDMDFVAKCKVMHLGINNKNFLLHMGSH